MLADVKRNMRYLLQFKKYGLDLFKHMYSYKHIDIKRDKFRLIPVEPTQTKFDIPNMKQYTYKFKGLSYNKYQYHLISIVNFHEHIYTTITNKIYRKPITLNRSISNIQKSYMLVIPKTNTPIESNSASMRIQFLMQPTNIRLCELNSRQLDIVTTILFSLTKVDKSGYNVSSHKYNLLERLRVYKKKKRYKNK